MKRILLLNPPVLCVNQCQLEWYAFAHPTSLLKIAAFQKSIGNSVDLVDCMAYENHWNRPLHFYKKLAIGHRDLGLGIPTYILGRTFDWLARELASRQAPDEIWISCHLTFNSELAHAAIATIAAVFPGIPIVFGGNYPTLFPGDAARSGARVFEGRLSEALFCFPDYSVFHAAPDYFVFQLTLGCENDCSHCVNHRLGPVVTLDPAAVVRDIESKRSRYGRRKFINIDPNPSGGDLELFLETVIGRGLDVELYFYGGIPPNRVTREMVTLMKQANVKGITLPRERGDALNRKLRKKYLAGDFHQAVRLFQEQNFDFSLFHCSFPVGLRDDDLDPIREIIGEIQGLGAVAEMAPVCFIPGTPEFERHADLLTGKSLEELNWALWPGLDSIEKIRAYSALYCLAHQNRFHHSWAV